MRLRHVIFQLALLGICGLAIAADRPVITNMSVFALQQVEDVPGMDICADLTKCQLIGKEFDVTVLEHDSLTSVLFPNRRYDFTMFGDTTILVCEEMRSARLSFPAGLIFSCGSDNACLAEKIEGNGRYRQSYDIYADLSATVFPASASSLISAQCDTLTDIRFDHIRRITRFAFLTDSVQSFEEIPDSIIMTSVTDTYLLTAIDELFPRVLKRVDVLSGSNGSVTDSAAYILVSNPVKLNRVKRRNLPSNRNISHPDDNSPNVIIAPDGNSVTIVPNGLYADLSAVISDVSGRVFIAKKISGSDNSVVDISALPRGEYLIQVLSDDKTVTVIKYSSR